MRELRLSRLRLKRLKGPAFSPSRSRVFSGTCIMASALRGSGVLVADFSAALGHPFEDGRRRLGRLTTSCYPSTYTQNKVDASSKHTSGMCRGCFPGV